MQIPPDSFTPEESGGGDQEGVEGICMQGDLQMFAGFDFCTVREGVDGS